jgi:hypothetical protein
LGSRNWEDHSSRPGWAKNLQGSPSTNKMSIVVCTYNIIYNSSYAGSINQKIRVKAGQGKTATHHLKITKTTRAWDMALVEEHLPSKNKIMTSNPSIAKNSCLSSVSSSQLESPFSPSAKFWGPFNYSNLSLSNLIHNFRKSYWSLFRNDNVLF